MSSVLLIQLYYFMLIGLFLFGCHVEKNKDKQSALGAIFYAASNPIKACDSESLTSNRQMSILLEKEVLYCNDPALYKFDSRVFSPYLAVNINSVEEEIEAQISYESKILSFPLTTLLFSTKNAILLDESGNKKNPQMYNYIEYRATLFDRNGTYTGIAGVSEVSPTNALLDAIEKCKQGKSNE